MPRGVDARSQLPMRGALIACLLWLPCSCSKAPEPAPAPEAAPVAPASQPAVVTVRFGAFSTTGELFGTRLLPAFAKRWRLLHSQDVDCPTLFAGAEALTRAITGEFAADVAVLPCVQDLDGLIAGGFVAPTWRDQPERGIACRSIVVIAVRKGNPKDIHGWADLAKPGLRVITPEPTTSGGGRWNVLALYGAAWRGHAGVPAGEPAAALDFVRRVLANSGARKANANDSFRDFRDGAGDVAITSESEVLLGWIFGRDEERVIPPSTVLMEIPAVLVGKNVDRHGVRPAAEGLLRFLWSSEAQKEIAFCGLRPVDSAVAAASAGQFPVPADLWTIDDLGGWDRARREILVPAGFAPTVPK